MLLTMLPMAAFAAGDVYSGTCGASGDNIKWRYDDETHTLYITGTGKMKDYGAGDAGPYAPWARNKDGRYLPKEIEKIIVDEGVTRIGNGAFGSDYGFHRYSYHSVQLPSTLTEIGDYAFSEAHNLTGLILPQKLKKIGCSAFADSGLTKLHIPESLREINAYAFMGTNFSQVSIPDWITEIGDGAFWGCSNLQTVKIGAGVKTIGENVFQRCFELGKIELDSNNKNFVCEDGILYNADKTELICYPPASEIASYTIPASVKEVDISSFWDTINLRELKVPSGVELKQSYSTADAASYSQTEHFAIYFDGSAPETTSLEVEQVEKDEATGYFDLYSPILDIYYNVNANGWDSWIKQKGVVNAIEHGWIVLHPQGTLGEPIDPEPSVAELTFNTFDGQLNISVVDKETVGSTITLRDEASVTFDDKRFIGWRDTSTSIDYAPGASYVVPDHDVRFEAIFESVSEPSAVQVTFNTYDGQMKISMADQQAVGSTMILWNEASTTIDGMRFIGWRDTSSGIDYAPGAAYIVPNHNVRFEALFESISASEPDMETPSVSDNGNDNETEERSSRRARRKSDNSSSDRESASVDKEKTSDEPQIMEPQFAPEQPEVTAAAQAHVFADVPAHEWYAAAADYVTSRGLMTGTSAMAFSPNVTMTRAMLWTVLARADGTDTDGGAVWYDKGRTWAQSNGISDGSNPDGMVTREQIASMLYRTAKASADSGNLSGYPDSGKVSDWAAEAMQWAVASGLITGKSSGALDPQGAATRAEVAQILMRYQQNGAAR